MNFVLPPVPSAFTSSVKIHSSISKPKAGHVQSVGVNYESYVRRQKNNITEEEDYERYILPKILSQAKLKDSSADDEKFVVEGVDAELLYLDPVRWKEQDHYRVLGLGKLRVKATPAQIKKAHQKRALEFHPDKRAALGDANDDTFFKCVQKAYEVLSDPVKRRQFDSVDPTYSDEIPKPTKVETPQDFFRVYQPVFEREARFSRKTPVPSLGDMNTPREETEAFYRFWTSFDSWRSYEYLDKEKEEAENREEKRWQDKQNKADRMRRKKEDNKRVSSFIAQAMAQDPRIEKYKEEEHLEKERKKAARDEAAKKAAEEKRLVDEQKRAAEAMEAEAEKERLVEEKKRRDQKKKLLRAEKKAVREYAKSHAYFVDDPAQTPAMTLATRASEIDVLMDNLPLDAISNLHKSINACANDAAKASTAISDAITKVISKNPAVAASFTSFVRGAELGAKAKEERSKKQTPLTSSKYRKWEAEELELLIKATNKFPGGTLNRWDTISRWLSHHGGWPRRTETELLHKTAELRKGANTGVGELVKGLQNKKSNNDDKRLANEASVRYDGPGLNQQQKQQQTDRPWTPEEQAQLERAMQAYPPSYKADDRWDKIADGVAGRSKKECKKRVKFLAEQIRAKKAASSSS